MAEKVTIMVLKVVDLQCSRCYKKIKKILCKFPQIRDQVYDEKANTVTITVVCCDPEKIRDKLCCKGHRVIKSIEIKDPPKPKEPEKPIIIVVEKPEEPEKPKPGGPPQVEKPQETPQPDPPKIPDPPMQPEPVVFPGLPPLYPVPTCCSQCYAGHDGGPCQRGYGVPPPPRPCFEGYYGCRCGYGYGRDFHDFSRCDYYLSEENPSSCSVM
ncbi:uncharacterized protein LOC142519503 [Primulina tabacum]|uniref:uncharacterized protein LOC142519503 n=1 Tax=Primulina tabacum TaxID=48773 RepID=UPI003F5A5779